MSFNASYTLTMPKHNEVAINVELNKKSSTFDVPKMFWADSGKSVSMNTLKII